MYEITQENYNNLYTVNDNNNNNNTSITYEIRDKTAEITEERSILKNFIKTQLNVPDKYVKYVAMIVCHLVAIIFFTIIYYLMMLDFDNYYFIPKEFKEEHFKNYKLLIALFMSINFQTTTAYVDIKLDNILARLVVSIQLCMTFLITFFTLLI